MDLLLEKMITTREAGKLSGYSADYLSRLIRLGKIVGKKYGNSWLVDSESLSHFVEDQKHRNFDRARELSRTRSEEFSRNDSPAETEKDSSHVPAFASSLSKFPHAQLFAASVAFIVISCGALVAQAASAPGFSDRAAEAFSNAASAIAEVPIRVLSVAQDGTAAVLRAHEVLTYRLAIAGPNLARAFTEGAGTMGDFLVTGAAEFPHVAADTALRVAALPSRVAPVLAQNVFGAEYAGARAFVAAADESLSAYQGALNSAGALAYGSASGASALLTQPFAPRAASAADRMVAALSFAEQSALATYETIHGLFSSAGNAIASLFTPTPQKIAVVSNPPPIAPPFAATTTAQIFTPTRTPPPPTAFVLPPPRVGVVPAPIPALPQTIITYPKYTTVVNGASESFVNQALASLRSDILATVGGMIQPVAAQTATNITTIQQVNRIDDLSNLIVRSGDFRGGTFDSGSVTNARSITGTSASFSTLTVSATTTIGSLTFASSTATSTAANGINLTAGCFAINGTCVGGSSGSGTVPSGTAGQFPYYAASGTTLTATSSIFLATSGNFGIGTTSPYAKLSIWGGDTLSTSKALEVANSASTTLLTVTNAGNIGVGTTSPYSMLSVAGQVVGQNFVATSTTATSTFNGGLAVGTGSAPSGLVYDRSTGNVGIGTASPGNKLYVSSTAVRPAYITSNVAGDNTILTTINTNGNWGDIGAVRIGVAAADFASSGATGDMMSIFGYYNNINPGTRIVEDSGNPIYFNIGGSAFTHDTALTNTKMTIDSTGNVGVGTTTPWGQLSASSTSAFATLVAHQHSTGPSALFLGGKVGVGTTSPSADLTIWGSGTGSGALANFVNSASTTVLHIEHNGHIGVGTTNPSYPLQIGNGFGDDLGFVTGSSGVQLGSLLNEDISFFVNSGGFTPSNFPLIIKASGNIAIGTTTPWGQLSASSTSAFPTLAVEQKGAGPVATFLGGNVGVGTTSPWMPFSVNANAVNTGFGSATAIIRSANAAEAGLIIENGNTNGRKWGLYVGATTSGVGPGNFSISDVTGSANRLVIASSTGNVGLATSSPWRTLSVAGSAAISGLTTSTTGNYVCINTTTFELESGTTCSLSSERFKTDIAPLSASSGLAEVLALKPVSFKFKPGYGDSGATTQLGFLAEEAVKIDPRLVPIDASGLPGGFVYPNYTAVLTQAFHQLGGALDVVNALSGTSTLRSLYAGTTSPAIAVDESGNVRLGAGALSVSGEVSAPAFAAAFADPGTALGYLSATTSAQTLDALLNLRIAEYPYGATTRLGLVKTDVASSAPELLTASGGMDLYSLATLALSGVQELARNQAGLGARVDSLEARLKKLEDGSLTAPAAPAPFSAASLASAFSDFGVSIQKGLAQFDTVSFRRLVAATDASGASSAGSATILAGNTAVEVANALVTPSTKIFITFNGPVTGSWWIAQKSSGSFRVKFSAPQTADVPFDYFLVQTDGASTPPPPANNAPPQQNSTSTTASSTPRTPPPTTTNASSTPSGGGSSASSTPPVIDTSTTLPASTTPPTSSATTTPPADTTPPVVTLSGPASIQITAGASFTDPGATALDNVDGDLTAKIKKTGTVDTQTPGTYTLTYSATDAAGNTGSATRTVTVVPAPPPPPPPTNDATSSPPSSSASTTPAT